MLKITNVISANSSDNMDHGLHYAFYDHSEKGFAGPKMYAELLSSATDCVEICDPYFNCGNGAEDHLLFSNIAVSVSIYYLTKGTKSENCRLAREKAQKIWDNIPTGIQSGCVLYYSFITNETDDTYDFHDRWLIIDKSRYFIVGGSINYHSGTPTCSTGIYEVTDIQDQQLIRSKFDKFFQHAVNNAAQIVMP